MFWLSYHLPDPLLLALGMQKLYIFCMYIIHLCIIFPENACTHWWYFNKYLVNLRNICNYSFKIYMYRFRMWSMMLRFKCKYIIVPVLYISVLACILYLYTLQFKKTYVTNSFFLLIIPFPWVSWGWYMYTHTSESKHILHLGFLNMIISFLQKGPFPFSFPFTWNLLAKNDAYTGLVNIDEYKVWI